MNQILDSQGRPVQIVSRAAKSSYDHRGPAITAPGKTMLSKFAGSGSADLARFKKLASDVQTANPSIRSPLLNQSNFYMPESDSSTGEPNRLLNQWITYYLKWHHACGSIISLHSELPLSRFALRGISDPTILRFYEDMAESMELHLKSVDILKQYFGYGEAIPFAFWSDKYNCFTDLTLLDTNFVYVKGHYLLHSEDGDDVEFYELEPDPLLQNLVKSDDYVNQLLSANLDEEFISAVRQNKRVLLSNFSTHMIKDRLKYSDLRGTSILLRCLKSLLYSDKLRESQYVVADGHVNPKWIWKIGQAGDLATGGYMPSEDDLTAFRDLLVNANNDPLFTIITHYAVNVDAVGLNGKLLPITAELQQIEDEILTALFCNKAMTTGQGPNFACYDEETETLTENGFKKIDDIQDDEKIATFNPATEQLEYHLPISKHIYDFDSERDGKMVHFKTGKIDCCVTPNHRMYTRNRWAIQKDGPWGIIRADEVKERAQFRSQIKWEGLYQDVPKEAKEAFGKEITLADWCELVGYFLAEGWVVNKLRDYRVGIRQLHTSNHYEAMKTICEKYGFSIYQDSFIIYGKTIAAYFDKTFGHGSGNKSVPKWMKNLPTPYLNILMNAMVDGDGNRRAGSRKKPTNNQYYSYCSTSKVMADDMYEIVYKLGFVPKASADKKVPINHNRRYYVAWSDTDNGKFPKLHSMRKKTVNRVAYKGRVYCFEVPHHLFITRRNGIVTIQGNTASIAFRTLMSRYIPVRAKLERYYYQKLFAPTAYANKFYERKQCDLDHNVRTGDEETNKLLIPTIDWRSKSNLLDDGSIKSIISSMVGTGRLPMKILTEALDLDYTEVRDFLYSEQATVFDPVTIDGRKKIAANNTDETMIGQPYAPKTNKPVSLKAARGQAAPAKAAKASVDKKSKFAGLLTIKPLKVLAADDFAVPKDPVQTQINKGKPEVGGNPEMKNPMSDEAVALDMPKMATSDSTLSEEEKKVVAKRSNDRMESKQNLVGKQFSRHKGKERCKVVEGSKGPLKNDFMKMEPFAPQEAEVVSVKDEHAKKDD